MERIPVTKEGYETLKKELENLKRVERPENIKAIEEERTFWVRDDSNIAFSMKNFIFPNHGIIDCCIVGHSRATT